MTTTQNDWGLFIIVPLPLPLSSKPEAEFHFLFHGCFSYKKKISFLANPWHMAFPGQGSNPSWSCNLYHSCSNTRSLTHRTRPGIESASLPLQRQSSLLHHGRNSIEIFKNSCVYKLRLWLKKNKY